MSHSATRTPMAVKLWFVLAFLWIMAIGYALTMGLMSFVHAKYWPRLVWGGDDKSASCQQAKAPLKVVEVLATAYSSDVGQTDGSPCITSTGFDLCQNYALYGASNTVAANFLQPHTIVKIPELFGDETFVVRDRMNDRFSNRIDIWMPTRAQAVRFGVKYVNVEVYGPN